MHDAEEQPTTSSLEFVQNSCSRSIDNAMFCISIIAQCTDTSDLLMESISPMTSRSKDEHVDAISMMVCERPQKSAWTVSNCSWRHCAIRRITSKDLACTVSEQISLSDYSDPEHIHSTMPHHFCQDHVASALLEQVLIHSFGRGWIAHVCHSHGLCRHAHRR